ncbi:MAG: cation transporter [Blautia sp.]|nr:cation transporter [Blautia sp.]
MTLKIILLACFAGACLIWLIVRRIRHGGSCCGEREGPEKKISSKDRNPRNYPYEYRAEIDGMVCANCVRKVENAFNSREGFLAKVDLGNRTAKIHTKQPIREEDVIHILSDTSYTVIDFERKQGEETNEIK